MATINDVAQFIGGIVTGDGNLSIKGIASPEYAVEGDITFALSKEGFINAVGSKASCILSTEPVENCPKPILQVKDMKEAMVVLYNAMLEMTPPAEGSIHSSALIDGSVKLGENVTVGPNVVIEKNTQIGSNSVIKANTVIGENVKIGDGCSIYSNVTIYKQCVLGNKVVIHSGTVIGADGFGYIQKNGKSYKVPQLCNVIIEDDVEIGANACIDRGTFTTTVIGKGSKIDNLVQIAHNIKVGKDVLIAAQTGIAGSATIGDNAMIGGAVGITDHASIGKNVKIGAKSGVHGHVQDDKVVLGYPAREGKAFMKLNAVLTQILKHERKFRKFLINLPEK